MGAALLLRLPVRRPWIRGDFSDLFEAFSDFWDPWRGRLFQDFLETFWLLSEPIFGKGMRRSTFSVKKRGFSEKGGGNSVNEGFGKDFYRKGNSVKRFGPFTETADSEN